MMPMAAGAGGGSSIYCYKIVILTAFVNGMKSVGLHKNKIIYYLAILKCNIDIC